MSIVYSTFSYSVICKWLYVRLFSVDNTWDSYLMPIEFRIYVDSNLYLERTSHWKEPWTFPAVDAGCTFQHIIHL